MNLCEDGTYECPCLIGFTRVGPHFCTDIDECSLGTHSCDSNAFCTNTIGSYTCDCPLGYDGLGYIKVSGYYVWLITLNDRDLINTCLSAPSNRAKNKIRF